jgi:hypothetical protein
MPLYYEEKDAQRINDIVSKARYGNSTEYTLASTQANRITHLDKAIRRASAAISILGAGHHISRTFIARARFLGYTGDFSGHAPNGQVPINNRRQLVEEKKEDKAPKIKLVATVELGSVNILDQLERFTSK